MLKEYPGKVYLALGYTDLRQGIDGLAQQIQGHYGKSLTEGELFLFCGRRNDRIKGLLWEGDGFLLLYKRMEKGRFQWPRKAEELLGISREQYTNLLEGMQVELNFLKSMLKRNGANRFGSASEKAEYISQIAIEDLFNEAEALEDASIPEPTVEDVTTVHEHQRKKRKDKLPKDLPRIREDYYPTEAERVCTAHPDETMVWPMCGETLPTRSREQGKAEKIA